MLELSKIRIDGDTQSRVELNQDVVNEYAQAMLDGVEFPPVKIFYDGADYWLADGFHRYFAAKEAGKVLILENIIPGTKRDAILYSVGANTTHGVRRTNADKRKAVVTLLNDLEWSNWSDNQIAKACSVSQPFVGKLRELTSNIISEESDCSLYGNLSDDQKTTERTYTTKHGTQATMQVGNIGKTRDECSAATLPQVDAGKEEASDEPEYVDDDELYMQMDAMQEELELLRKVVEEDDQLNAATEEIKRLKAVERVLQGRLNELMNKDAEQIKKIKRLQSKIDKLEAARV